MKIINLQISPELKPFWLNADALHVPALNSEDKYYYIKLGSAGLEYNFEFDKLYKHILFERYVDQKRPLYTYLPFHYHKIPGFLRYLFHKGSIKSSFPLWPMEQSLEIIREIGSKYGLFSDANYAIGTKLPMGAKYFLILTHDVEAQNNWHWVKETAQIEMDLGFRSSWNVVPHYYKLDYGVLDWLVENGFEIGLHGYNHDNKLAYRSVDAIRNKIKDSMGLIERYKIVGFRSPSLLRSDNLFKALEEYFIYDMSIMDVDYVCPAGSGGSCSLFPYYIKGKLLEIPTTIQYEAPMYFGVSHNEINKFWSKKIEWIKAANGMVSVISHPDPHYSGNDTMLKEYRHLLEGLKKDNTYCTLLPRDVAVK